MDENDDLLNEVREGICARKGEWKRMASEINGVSYSWIWQVGSGNYKSAPSYARLRAVREWLRANPITTSSEQAA